MTETTTTTATTTTDAVPAYVRKSVRDMPVTGEFANRAELLAYRRENHPDHTGYTSATPIRVPASWTPETGMFPLNDPRGHFAIRVRRVKLDDGATAHRFDVTYDGKYVRGYVAGGFAAACVNRVFGTFMRAANIADRGFTRRVDADGIIVVTKSAPAKNGSDAATRMPDADADDTTPDA